MADAAARAEFQRKQRDRKRLYRKRLKVLDMLLLYTHTPTTDSLTVHDARQDDMTAMRAQVTELEATYAELYAQRVHHQQQQAEEATAELQLRRRYEAARAEMTALRRQIADTKKQLSDFDLFTASLECYLSEFPSPASSADGASPAPSSTSSASSTSSPRTPRTPHALKIDAVPSPPPHAPFAAQMNEAACQEIIRECYQAIVTCNWTGRSVSSGAEMLGWTDQRFVDGGTLQFALSKAFPALGKEYLMQRTWDILTTSRYMRTMQVSTLEVTILQRMGNDIVLLERRVNHPQLNRISCVQLLIFRLRTPTGYIIAYKAVNPPGSPQESAASAAAAAEATTPLTASSPSWSDDDNDLDDELDRTDAGSSDSGSRRRRADASAKPKPKLAWVDTMQWFVFDDLLPSLGDDDLLPSLDDEFDGSRGCNVLIGGRTANRDDSYANFFLFEVVTYIIRWESAVAGARLLLA